MAVASILNAIGSATRAGGGPMTARQQENLVTIKALIFAPFRHRYPLHLDGKLSCTTMIRQSQGQTPGAGKYSRRSMDSGARTATTRAVATSWPAASMRLATTAFFDESSSICPRTSRTTPIGVGLRYWTDRDAVTQRGTGASSPGSWPSWRKRARAPEPVL